MDEPSVGRLLKSLKFSHVSVRPRHPQADAVAQEAHKKTSRAANRSNCGGRTKRGLARKAA
jgi:hypothetical protein